MKSGCIETVKLYDYVTGRLSEQDACSVEAHLADCDICLEQFVTVQALLDDRELMNNKNRIKEVGAPIINALLSRAKRFFEWTVQPPAQPAFAVRDSAVKTAVDKDCPSNYLKIVQNFGSLSGEMAFKKRNEPPLISNLTSPAPLTVMRSSASSLKEKKINLMRGYWKIQGPNSPTSLLTAIILFWNRMETPAANFSLK